MSELDKVFLIGLGFGLLLGSGVTVVLCALYRLRQLERTR